MTRKEAERLAKQSAVLQALGFTAEEAEQLRRISMTLQRWHELECGTGEGQVSVSVERDENEKPFKRIQYPSKAGYVDQRYPIADRETGAKRRLAKILKARNERPRYVNGHGFTCAPGALEAYIQTDPRGAALYIIRPGDVRPGQDVSCCYTNGICVY